MKNKVFISFKMHNEFGELTKDYLIAKKLYIALTEANIDAFFSDVSLLNAARADYKKKIDDELDEASILVVVATSAQNVNSNWVRYEWDSFYNDILSDKKKGELLSLIADTQIRDLPRTLRQTQAYEYADDGIQKTVIFVQNYFAQKHLSAKVNHSKKGSSYGYDLGDEKSRLKIQAKDESKNDFTNISSIFENFRDDQTLNVLDFGCSMGETTRRIFLPFGKRINLIGVDKFQNCVDEFNEKSTPFHAVCADIDHDDFTDVLLKEMKAQNIKGFHLVYCALSLHHTADTLAALKKLWNLLLPGGYIYIRTCDDGLKIGYPDPNGIIQKLIERTANVDGVSDRFHGRKLYGWLKRAKFIEITGSPFVLNTVDKDVVDRYALFSNTFLWRKNYFKKALDAAALDGDEDKINKALEDYNWCLEKTEQIEDMFDDLNFYYEYYVTIVTAKKKTIINDNS